jgi:hypothetical protein
MVFLATVFRRVYVKIAKENHAPVGAPATVFNEEVSTTSEIAEFKP